MTANDTNADEQAATPPKPPRLSLAEADAIVVARGDGHALAQRARDMLRSGFASDLGDTVAYLDGGAALDRFEVEDVTLVGGDLRISGLLRDTVDNDQSLLIVLGSLEVDRAVIGGEVIVLGDLRVHDTIVLDSMGDYVLSVGGDLTARGLASCDHHIEVRGRARVEFEYKRGMDASAVLNAACLKQGDPGFHDLNEIIARVAAGEPIFAGES